MRRVWFTQADDVFATAQKDKDSNILIEINNVDPKIHYHSLTCALYLITTNSNWKYRGKPQAATAVRLAVAMQIIVEKYLVE